MTPAANGTDERLDAVLDVLRAIRKALEPTVVHVETPPRPKRKRSTERVCGSWPDDPADVIE